MSAAIAGGTAGTGAAAAADTVGAAAPASPTARPVSAGARRRRFWFGLDAAVTGANAVAYLVLGGLLADHLGGAAGTTRAVGAGLLFFALAVGRYAAGAGRHDEARTVGAGRAGWAIVAANAAWVAASLVVAATGVGGFEALGRTWVVLQALVVAGLTAAQVATLRADLAGPATARGRG